MNPSRVEHWVKFGKWVERQRTARRLSKADACKLSGLSPSSWYNIENGGRIKDGQRIVHQPSTESLLGIAKAFNMDPAEVFEAAKVPMPSGLAAPVEPASRPPAAEQPPAAVLPLAASQAGADPVLLSLIAQLLAEQRELRATIHALREEMLQKLER